MSLLSPPFLTLTSTFVGRTKRATPREKFAQGSATIQSLAGPPPPLEKTLDPLLTIGKLSSL